ncbi:MAG: GLPGLI family protein [Bacteroidetes bacterium]|nr:MAG: GLPGLI family protein [Bacteroidota bacterium]
MRTLILSTILTLATICSAQNFQGKATYKQHRKFSVKVKGNPTLQKQIEEQMRKQSQQTYILHFTPTESIYEQETQLNTPTSKRQSGVTVNVMDISSKAKLYKNIKEQRFVEQKDFFGKTFLIADSLKMPQWELTEEQKNIGQYKCYKALWKLEHTTDKLNPKTGKFEPKKEDFIITVWYTPDIPVSNGPETYYGLPGLILEVQYGKTTIACTEIVMNNSEKVTIEAPKKGKKMNQKEFDKMKDKKIKEMNKRNKSKRKGKDKNGISISIEA